MGQISAGWFYAAGDPPDTVRYWDGGQWLGEPELREQVFLGEETAFDPNGFVTGPVARIGARLVDGAIWLVLIMVTVIPVVRNFVQAAPTLPVGQPDQLTAVVSDIQRQFLLAGLISTALIVAYETLMNGWFSATLGKKIVGCEVVDTDGQPIGLRRAFLRTVPLIALQLIAAAANLFANIRIEVFWLVALVGLIMLFVDRRRQTPWDKVAATMVIKAQVWR